MGVGCDAWARLGSSWSVNHGGQKRETPAKTHNFVDNPIIFFTIQKPYPINTLFWKLFEDYTTPVKSVVDIVGGIFRL